MATRDHVRDFLLPLESDPVVALRDALTEAAATDPELATRLRALASQIEKHPLSLDVPDDGLGIGGISGRATPLLAAGYLRAREALRSGARIGDLGEAVAKAEAALARLEPDFVSELATSLGRRMTVDRSFRRRLDAAAADVRSAIAPAGPGKQAMEAMARAVGGSGEGFCTICVDGQCRPGTFEECMVVIVIIVVIVVAK